MTTTLPQGIARGERPSGGSMGVVDRASRILSEPELIDLLERAAAVADCRVDALAHEEGDRDGAARMRVLRDKLQGPGRATVKQLFQRTRRLVGV